MGILGTALSAFGLGQEDIRKVTEQTLQRVDKRDTMTIDERKGVAIALAEMLNTLRAEDVITAGTHTQLFAKIERWRDQGPAAAKKPKK